MVKWILSTWNGRQSAPFMLFRSFCSIAYRHVVIWKRGGKGENYSQKASSSRGTAITLGSLHRHWQYQEPLLLSPLSSGIKSHLADIICCREADNDSSFLSLFKPIFAWKCSSSRLLYVGKLLMIFTCRFFITQMSIGSHILLLANTWPDQCSMQKCIDLHFHQLTLGFAF